MEVKDLYTSGYSFEIEGKKISFKMIAYGNALKAQNAIHFIATNEPSNIAKGNEILLDLALKHTIIEGSEGGADIESPILELFASQFKNPFASAELQAQFRDYVLGFLGELPTFRKAEQNAQA